MTDYVNTLQNAHIIRMMAQNLDIDGCLDDALEKIDRADSVGAILDPTAYMCNAQKMHEDREVIAAVRTLARLGSVPALQENQRRTGGA